MMNQVQKNFAEKLKNIDFFRSLEFSRRERVKKYPIETLRLFLVGYILKFLMYKLRLLSPLVSAKTFWGDKMKVVFPDNRAIYHYGVLDGEEIPVTNFIVNYLKEGSTFLDAGAHAGYYTLLASKIVGPRGSVHAFEPTPRTFAILKDNVHASGRSNIRLNRAALMEKKKSVEIIDFGIRHGGLNSALSWDELPAGFVELSAKEKIKIKKIPAKSVTVDEYCKKDNICPDLVKIDVEGSEYPLLLGAGQILKKCHPALVVEIWQNKDRKNNFKKIIDFLKGYSYRPYHFKKDLAIAPYRKGDEIGCLNIVFLADKSR